MAILDLFSKRKARAAREGKPDVYEYDSLPSEFRMQVVHIWTRALLYEDALEGLWNAINNNLAEQHGLLSLPENYAPPLIEFNTCLSYFRDQKDVLKALDIIEYTFKMINAYVRQKQQVQHIVYSNLVSPDEAIDDLNTRFREHSIGYRFEKDANEIIRVDCEYVHAEAVKPALHLLLAPEFAGANDEFLRAHTHYRDGKHKEAINEALKAFESTLKSICTLRGWPYDPDKDTAKKLLDIVMNNGLIPEFLKTSFAGIRSVLEATVPTVRSRTSAHGQGPVPKDVPAYFAAYVLHVTASSIVFLVEAHRAAKA